MNQAEPRWQVQELPNNYEKLLAQENRRIEAGNGVFDRYAFPVLTAEHGHAHLTATVQTPRIHRE
jgi:hypothetical protein